MVHFDVENFARQKAITEEICVCLVVIWRMTRVDNIIKFMYYFVFLRSFFMLSASVMTPTLPQGVWKCRLIVANIQNKTHTQQKKEHLINTTVYAGTHVIMRTKESQVHCVANFCTLKLRFIIVDDDRYKKLCSMITINVRHSTQIHQ